MFHSLATDPQSIYYSCIHQYKKFFFDSNFGMLIVHRDKIVNANPFMVKALECNSPNVLLGRPIHQFMSEPIAASLTKQTYSWFTELGNTLTFETLTIRISGDDDFYTAFLIGKEDKNSSYLSSLAKQLALIFQDGYRPALLFDSKDPRTQQLIAHNPSAEHFFDLGSDKPFSTAEIVHEKDYDGYIHYSNFIHENGSSQYPFQLKHPHYTSQGLMVQNFSLTKESDSRVLTLFTDQLSHYALDAKTRFNYKKLEDYFNVTPHAMAIVDKNMIVREINLGFIHQFKYNDEEIIGKPINAVLSSPADGQCLLGDHAEKICELVDRYGNKSAMRIHDIPLYLEDEFVGNYLLFSEACMPIALDIKQLKDDLFVLTPEHILLLDEDFEVTWSNLHYVPYSNFYKNANLSKSFGQHVTKASLNTYVEMVASLRSGDAQWYGQLWLYDLDHRKRFCNVSISQMQTESGDIHYIAVLSHYKKNIEAKELLSFLAYQDPTFNLPNHVYTEYLLENLIASSSTTHHKLSVIGIRLFQSDSHYPGELKHEVYQTAVTSLSTLFGSDIQISLTEKQDLLLVHSNIRSKRNAVQTLMLIQKELIQSLESHGIDFENCCCLGYAQYPHDGKGVNQLLAHLDQSLESKTASAELLRQYEAQRKAPANREGMVLRYLREGLHKGEFYIVYQPLIDLKTKKVVGLETLLRWKNENVGNLPPKDFIPLAEKSNAIVKLGYFVIGETVRKLYKLRNEGYDLTSSINISIKQLEAKDFSEQILRVLTDYELPASALQFEITESISASSHPNVMANIITLADFGIVFNIDDFGTGYSSLKQLQSLKVKGLKIDRSLIQDIVENAGDQTLVKALSAMAKNAGLKLIAEGVENKEQLEILEAIGFEEAQGFLFSVPLGDQDLDQFIKENDSQLFS